MAQMITDITLVVIVCSSKKRFKMEIEMFRIQKETASPRVRFKVTVCLYLKPNNRARSLSTLIAVSVHKDTPLRLLATTLFRLTSV